MADHENALLPTSECHKSTTILTSPGDRLFDEDVAACVERRLAGGSVFTSRDRD